MTKMSEPKRILYRGVPMIEGWPEKIFGDRCCLAVYLDSVPRQARRLKPEARARRWVLFFLLSLFLVFIVWFSDLDNLASRLNFTCSDTPLRRVVCRGWPDISVACALGRCLHQTEGLASAINSGSSPDKRLIVLVEFWVEVEVP